MSLLGIDYGTKRVGIAKSDESNTVAFPVAVLKNTSSLVDEIQDHCEKGDIKGIVVGHSKNFQGEDNSLMESVYSLNKLLKDRLGIPIYLEPEFLTSVQAERVQGAHDMLDASAAALILQSYLDRSKHD